MMKILLVVGGFIFNVVLCRCHPDESIKGAKQEKAKNSLKTDSLYLNQRPAVEYIED